MPSVQAKARCYILDRLCPRGGFCFYRLDEPNPHDTYHALAALRCLGLECVDPATRNYLQSLQRADGAFDALVQAFFAIRGLQLMHSAPRADPRACIDACTSRTLARAARTDHVEATTLCQDLYRLAVVRQALALGWEDEPRDRVLGILAALGQDDGGYGIKRSTLVDSFFAVAALRHLGQPVDPASIEPFLRSCEHPVFGFTGIPGTALFFLEYLHAGLALCGELSLAPRYAAACKASLLRCQTDTGGFARTALASATMDNTFFALHGLVLLDRLQDAGRA